MTKKLRSKGSANLHIESLPISELRPYPGNPRKWTQEQLGQLATGMKHNGFIVPIVVNPKNMILGGHMRVAAAEELGYTHVPAVRIATKSKAQEREILLRLNRNQGDWDLDLLKEFDIGTLLDVGFDDTDLSGIWDDVLATEEDDFDVEKELEKIKKPKTKLGDLYKLGNHILICGDATDPAVVKKLVGRARMDMIYIDTPYNLSVDYNRGVGGKQQYGGQTDDSKSPEDYEQFLRAVYANAIAVGKDDLHVFGWNDETNVGLMQKIFTDLGLKNRRTCLWIKGAMNVVPSVAFGKCYEACIYATRGQPYLSDAHQNFHEILNREVGSGNRAIDDILDILNIWLERRIPGNEYEHATQKPVTLAERPLRRCTKTGGNVLDTTGGSGSTLINCEQMKRRCFMAEIEPVFCDLIVRRYETLTNTKASLIRS